MTIFERNSTNGILKKLVTVSRYFLRRLIVCNIYIFVSYIKNYGEYEEDNV